IIQPTLDRLEAEIENMRQAIDRNSDADRIDADYRFHGIIIEACGNRLFDELYNILRAFLYEEIRRTRTAADGFASVPEAHQKLIDIIKSGDISAALITLRSHIKDIKSLMERSYRNIRGEHKNLQTSNLSFS
ncbi:MAG: FCD domain-containing protein, partial [Desulfobacterales bacterium]